MGRQQINKLGKTIFLKKFGDNSENRILNFLVLFDNFDYSIKMISEKSEVPYSSAKILIKELIKKGFLIHSRDVGKAKMYRLNKEDPYVRHFIDFYWNITNEGLSNSKKKEKDKIKKNDNSFGTEFYIKDDNAGMIIEYEEDMPKNNNQRINLINH